MLRAVETGICILGTLIWMDEFHPMKPHIQNSHCNKIVVNKISLTDDVITEGIMGLFKINIVHPTESFSGAAATSNIIPDIHIVKERLKLEHSCLFLEKELRRNLVSKADFCTGVKFSSGLWVVCVSNPPWLCVIALERAWTQDSALEPW